MEWKKKMLIESFYFVLHFIYKLRDRWRIRSKKNYFMMSYRVICGKKREQNFYMCCKINYFFFNQTNSTMIQKSFVLSVSWTEREERESKIESSESGNFRTESKFRLCRPQCDFTLHMYSYKDFWNIALTNCPGNIFSKFSFYYWTRDFFDISLIPNYYSMNNFGKHQ